MAISQRPSLNKLIIQAQLNKFYSHPVARVSFGLVLTIIAITFFALFAIRPTLLTMAELIKQIDDRKVIDQKLSQKIAALSTAQAELASKQTDALVLDSSVPSTPRFPELLKQIERAASENSVVIGTLVTQTVPVERDVKTVTTLDLQSIPLTLTVSGSFEGLIGMLATLGNMQRILAIDRIDILPPVEDEALLLNLTISVRAFAFGAPAEPARPAAGGRR